MATAGYTGHGARTGGLQQHSIGNLYPYTIIGVTTHPYAPTQWQVMDCRTGNVGFLRGSYEDAERDVASLRIRNMMHS
jgi:hypothetical protein